MGVIIITFPLHPADFFRVKKLARPKGWISPTQICSASRARILAIKLEELGYLCEFSEADLLVSLPLKLRCEMLTAAGSHLGGETSKIFGFFTPICGEMIQFDYIIFFKGVFTAPTR